MTHLERIIFCVYILLTTYMIFYLSRVLVITRNELLSLRKEFMKAMCERLFDRIDEERAGE